MADFDPKAYLQKKQAQIAGFKSSDYLNQKIEESKPEAELAPPEFHPLESAGLGILQGGSLGYADEAEAALKAALAERSFTPSEEEYTRLRDQIRARYKEAGEQNPTSFTAGTIGGGLGAGIAAASLLPVTATGAILGGASLGALGALGTSEKDLTKGEVPVSDIAQGAALGGALGAVSPGISKLATSEVPLLSTLARVTERGIKGKSLSEKSLNKDIAQLARQKTDVLEEMGGGDKSISLQPIKQRYLAETEKAPAAFIDSEEKAMEALRGLINKTQKSTQFGEEATASAKDLDALRQDLFKLADEHPGTRTSAIAKQLGGQVSETLNTNPTLANINKSTQKLQELKNLAPELDINRPIVSTLKSIPTAANIAGAAGSKLSAAKSLTGIAETINPEDIKQSDVSKLTKNFYDMPMGELSEYAQRLQGSQFQGQADALQKAISEGDSQAKDRALFVLMQNPKARELMKEPSNSKISETLNSITGD